MQKIGFPIAATNPRRLDVKVLADSCCQNMLAGTQTLYRLGLTKRDMIPVSMRMKAANDGDITILGAILVRVWGLDKTGNVVETKQMCYITDGADRIFLNRDALTDLKIISEDFPIIGEAGRQPAVSSVS